MRDSFIRYLKVVFIICLVVFSFLTSRFIIENTKLARDQKCCGGYIDVERCVELKERFEEDKGFQGERVAMRSDCEKMFKFECHKDSRGMSAFDGLDCLQFNVPYFALYLVLMTIFFMIGFGFFLFFEASYLK